ncbi:MAG: ISAs1 family transposase [Planctomycetota bacterium]|nr:ISAs1 family transposase [Planctomycetota bacterium]
MQPAPAGILLAQLAQIPDPRGRQGRRHSFEAMIASVVCALLQGARGYLAIAEWIHCQPPEFWHLLGYTRRPPRRSAFRKLLLKLPAEQFEQALRGWIADCLGQPVPERPLQAVALDGKTLRGSLEKNLQPAVHLLSLLDQATGCVLSQIRVDDKTNEAKAALELLTTLVLKGRVVTGDAMFCQREICQQIIDSGGHYLFVVKDNQPTLREDVAAEFRAAFSPGE